MTPDELLDDHARRPRSLGKLLNASAVGDVGSIVAGDALRFYLKLEGAKGEERIAAARFQVFNCQGQIGPASVVAELAVGRSLAEAETLGAAEVCAHLGGLAHLELPPRLWGLEGLRAAAATWRAADLPADIELELPLLCRCMGIPEETVRQAIAVRALDQVDAIVEATGAGSVCGSCRVDMPALLARGAAAPAEKAGSAPREGRIILLRRIESHAQEVLARLRAEGSDLELWDLDGMRLRVRPHGRISEDREALGAAVAALEAALKSAVDPALTVEP
jgi:NifU-like protein